MAMGFKIRVFIFISLFLCSTSTFASKSRNLKNQINQHERTILKIKKKIEEMEKNLVSSNSHYLKMEKEKTRLEGKLFQANLKIKKVKENVEAELVNSQKILNALVINQLSENKTSKEILREKLLQKLVVSKIKKLKSNQKTLKKLENDIYAQTNKLNENYYTSKKLAEILSQLEFDKKTLANSYLKEVEQKEKLQGKYLKIQRTEKKRRRKKNRKKVAKSKVKLQFLNPIKNFLSTKYDKKGVTYKFQGNRDIFSTQSGKVVYSGPLSTYGNVLMIDHGNDTHSVILGKLKTQVAKGDTVVKGQTVGKTNSLNGETGSIYFEVRHKKQAQNTIKLIEKQRFTRNNTSNKQISFEGT